MVSPRRWWFFVPLAVGALVVAFALALSDGANRETTAEAAIPVRVMMVERASIAPTLRSFGEIRARQVWQGVAQVAGKVIWRHPDLQRGASFAQGVKLLEIEPLDYEVAESRADAQMRSAVASQAEVISRGEDLDKSIEIEKRSLEIAAAEYQRNLELAEEGHISKLQLERIERALLDQRQNLQNLETQANLLPAQRKAADARVAEAAAGLARAQEDVERTVFNMPFTGRIDAFNAEIDQFVPLGHTMITAHSTHDVEVLLEVPFEQLVARFPGIMADPMLMADPGQELQALLTYKSNLGEIRWRGHVSRIDTGLNPASRSASVYISVDLNDGETPPATSLYVQAEITGPEIEDAIAIPRLAWHAGSVLIVDEDNQLRRQPATIAFADEDRVVLRDGLAGGERLILSDLAFPAEGITVSPVVIEESAAL